MTPAELANVWGMGRALFPTSEAFASNATMAVWGRALAGYSHTVVCEVLTSFAVNEKYPPSLAGLLDGCKERSETVQRHAAIEAPKGPPNRSLELFVASMRSDRARRRAEAHDYAREHGFDADRREALMAEVESVRGFEAMAYRSVRDGGLLSTLLTANRTDESYATVDEFLAAVADEPTAQDREDAKALHDRHLAGEAIQWATIPQGIRRAARELAGTK